MEKLPTSGTPSANVIPKKDIVRKSFTYKSGETYAVFIIPSEIGWMIYLTIPEKGNSYLVVKSEDEFNKLFTIAEWHKAK